MEILMSWGIGQFTPAIFKDLPGLKFHVNGRLFQGDVLICLNGSDYYEVYLRDGTGVECISDEVCFDELTAASKAGRTRRNMPVSANRRQCRSDGTNKDIGEKDNPGGQAKTFGAYSCYRFRAVFA
mgnify:CR=1 FL=1